MIALSVAAVLVALIALAGVHLVLQFRREERPKERPATSPEMFAANARIDDLEKRVNEIQLARLQRR